ncbi:hypothetical protein UFOVP806_40 [uncultured Caudovirales phage]|uniref:Internal virion protein n=1 Tax=uncultured Caudovirales phage TaxID=2100421 RepID=A0A6J5NXH7_9CAUD|nr:hypothetical protein UFOVP806_40 [uncultured Caudovirales phage]
MCSPSLIALAAAGAAAGSKAIATNQSNKAQNAAVAAESQRQQRLQAQQQQYIAQQEAEKESARNIFQSLTPEISQQSMERREADIGTALGQAYSSAAAPSYSAGADPTRVGDAVSTVGSTMMGGVGVPKALDVAYAKNLARVLGFNTQQATARANMDALGIAQNRTNQVLQRGTEGIGLQGQIISGLGNNVRGISNLMDASSRDAQSQLQAAALKGENWRTASEIFGLIAAGAGAYGAAGAGAGAAAGSEAGATTSKAPIKP